MSSTAKATFGPKPGSVDQMQARMLESWTDINTIKNMTVTKLFIELGDALNTFGAKPDVILKRIMAKAAANPIAVLRGFATAAVVLLEVTASRKVTSVDELS